MAHMLKTRWITMGLVVLSGTTNRGVTREILNSIITKGGRPMDHKTKTFLMIFLINQGINDGPAHQPTVTNWLERSWPVIVYRYNVPSCSSSYTRKPHTTTTPFFSKKKQRKKTKGRRRRTTERKLALYIPEYYFFITPAIPRGGSVLTICFLSF